MNDKFKLSRRSLLKMLGCLPLATFIPVTRLALANDIRTRAIPSSGEQIPVIGIGSYKTINRGTRNVARAVLERFVEMGGTLVDTSPMYGEAETVIGELLEELSLHDQVFLATKVWTRGKSDGRRQIAESERLLRRKPLDLIQVHNLVDLNTQLATLRNMQQAGELRYVGITHYVASAHAELEAILRREKLDFLQINYSLAERNAARSLLPLAMDRGVAVIINRPYAQGSLFSRVRGQSLPGWAAEIDCESFGQVFLKYILGSPAVTNIIPATSKLHHLEDNMGALHGTVPDAALLRTIERWYDTL